MDKKLLQSTIYYLCTFVFCSWIYFIHTNLDAVQESRYVDALWLIHITYSWIYIIIAAYIIIFMIIYIYNINDKTLHILFLSQLALVIYGTPYIMSNYARFPDTFGVVKSSLLIGDILANNVHEIYPQSYPASYLTFNMVHLISNIDLFYFSRLIWTPLVLIGFITVWYLFIEKIFDSNIAIISSILAIPTQIIEVSLTPNSMAFILVLISLFLCVINNKTYRLLFIITLITLSLTHPINIIILMIFLCIFYAFGVMKKTNYMKITSTKLLIIGTMWFGWTLLVAPMGSGLARTIYNTITMDRTFLENAVTYTVGSGNLVYPWIQQINMYKYEIYLIFAAILIVYDVYYIYKTRTNIIINDFLNKRLIFFMISAILFAITLLNLIFGGLDTENIIGRTLNYSMLAISVIMASSFAFSYTSDKISFKNIKIYFFIFLVVVYSTYPVYAYARDSYINYPIAEGHGRYFLSDHVTEANYEDIDYYSKSIYFYQIMHGIKPLGNISNSYDGIIYTNGWYKLIDKGERL